MFQKRLSRGDVARDGPHEKVVKLLHYANQLLDVHLVLQAGLQGLHAVHVEGDLVGQLPDLQPVLALDLLAIRVARLLRPIEQLSDQIDK